jgi:hypothetical protein
MNRWEWQKCTARSCFRWPLTAPCIPTKLCILLLSVQYYWVKKQDVRLTLWFQDLKDQHRWLQSPPLDAMMSQFHVSPILGARLPKTHAIKTIILVSPSWSPSESFPRRFPTKTLYAFTVSPQTVTRLPENSPLDFTNLTTLCYVACRGLSCIIISLLNILNCSHVSSRLRCPNAFSEHIIQELFVHILYRKRPRLTSI